MHSIKEIVQALSKIYTLIPYINLYANFGYNR